MPDPPSPTTAAGTADPAPLPVLSIIVCGEGSVAAAIAHALRAAGHAVHAAADGAAVARVLAAAEAAGTHVDALVNAPDAAPALGTALDTPEARWDAIVDRELTAFFRACKLVVPHLIAHGGGAIVNVTGGAAYGRANRLADSAAHGSAVAFGAALAYDHFNDRVRVNTIVAGDDATPETIAPVAVFLVSPAADVMSGSQIDVGLAAYQGGR